jgi:hypothetical protein
MSRVRQWGRGHVVAGAARRRFVALKRLKWGDRWLKPGDEVPMDSTGRSYSKAVEHGQIAEVIDPATTETTRKGSK